MKTYVAGLSQGADLGRPPPCPRDGKTCAPSRWRSARYVRRNNGTVHRGRDEDGQAGARLLSSYRQLSGKDVRGRQNSRRLFQAGGTPFGKGDIGLAADRQTAAA